MVALTKPAAQVAAIRTLPGDFRKAAREFAERFPVETFPIYGKHEEKFGSRVKHKRGTPGLQDWPAWAWQKASGWGFMSCDPRFKPIDFDNLAAYERLIEPIPCLKETYTDQTFRGFHLLVYTAYPLPDTKLNGIELRGGHNLTVGAGSRYFDDKVTHKFTDFVYTALDPSRPAIPLTAQKTDALANLLQIKAAQPAPKTIVVKFTASNRTGATGDVVDIIRQDWIDQQVSILGNSTEDARNETLNGAAMLLYGLAYQLVPSLEGEITDALRAAAFSTGLKEREVDGTLASARRGASAKPPVKAIEAINRRVEYLGRQTSHDKLSQPTPVADTIICSD